MSIDVIATERGYHGDVLYEEGDRFTLVDIKLAKERTVIVNKKEKKIKVHTAEMQFSENWMERVETPAPEPDVVTDQADSGGNQNETGVAA